MYLTRRQTDVMNLLAEGMTSKQVAEKLGISVRTVEFHRLHIRKLCGACPTCKRPYNQKGK